MKGVGSLLDGEVNGWFAFSLYAAALVVAVVGYFVYEVARVAFWAAIFLAVVLFVIDLIS